MLKVVVSGLVLAVVVGVSGFLMTNSAEATSPSAAQEAPASGHMSAMTERVLGKPDAPVTLVEYASLTCSHCADFHVQIMPQIRKDYIETGKVKIIYRDFPFDEIGLKAAMVARCLPSDKYFDFLTSLFQTQASWAHGSDDAILRKMSGFAGMSEADYSSCVSDSALQDHLLEVRVNATNIDKVNSTPTFLIEGSLERVVGAQEYDAFKAVLDRQLEKVTTK